MSDAVASRVVVFLFVGVVVVAGIAWMSVAQWIGARTAERKDRERNALLRHLAGQPAESARLVLEKIREDDAAHAEAMRKLFEKGQRDAAATVLPFGLITIAASIGLCIFLYAVAGAENRGVWTLGLIPLFVGFVITGGALYRRRETATSEHDGSPSSTAR